MIMDYQVTKWLPTKEECEESAVCLRKYGTPYEVKIREKQLCNQKDSYAVFTNFVPVWTPVPTGGRHDYIK